ncbi:STAS-like domain-containing protein [Clostridium paraputrificum]|uniref:STAS-like domain-containing protein n=1 Tax=Clostridium paraputrificum TaxID=29363 RepID=UPI00374FA409
MNKKEVIIYDYISSPSAVTTEQGDIVYSKLYPIVSECIKNNSKIELNFKNIDAITTAFLNNAIGKLFYKFEVNDLLNNLYFTECKSGSIINSIKRSLSNAIVLSKLDK